MKRSPPICSVDRRIGIFLAVALSFLVFSPSTIARPEAKPGTGSAPSAVIGAPAPQAINGPGQPNPQIFVKPRELAADGHYQEALRVYDAILAKYPKSVTAHKERAAAYIGIGKLDKAIEEYDVIIKMDANNERYYQERAITFEKLNKIPQALADYDQIIRLNPHKDTPHFHKATLFEQSKDYKHAVQEYSMILKLNDDDDEAFRMRGHDNFLLGNNKEALSDLTHALELEPLYAVRAYEERAKVYDKLGQAAQAKKDREMAERLSR